MREPTNNLVGSSFVSQTGSVRAGNASVSLLDYDRTPTLDGLLRRQNGTASLHCNFTGALCPSTGIVVTRAYVYSGDRVVWAD